MNSGSELTTEKIEKPYKPSSYRTMLAVARMIVRSRRSKYSPHVGAKQISKQNKKNEKDNN